jgi:hypothetical protein
MEEKENRMTEEKIADSSMTDVSGGSWMITEDTGKEAGLSLRNPDGTPGEWGYLWNSGDYYWRGNKLTNDEAYAITQFYECFGKQPKNVKEAVQFYKKSQPI